MLRHKKKVHGEEKIEVEKEDLDDYTSSEESDMDTDSKSEETIDPWFDLVQQTFKALQPDFDETASDLLEKGKISVKEARKRAFAELLPKYRKYIINRYLFRVLWFDSVKNDSVHRSIRQTAKRLVDTDDYDSEESWKYATNKRKYLFDKLFKDYELPEISESQ